MTEKPTPGYELEGIKCVHEQGSGDWPKEPSKDSSQADGDTTVSGSTINLKVNYLGMGQVLRHEHPQAA